MFNNIFIYVLILQEIEMEEAIDTADFLLFVDRLLDSVNGSTIEAQMGKLFRCAVSGTSPHIAFWREAKAVLRSIKFVRDGKEFDPPTIENWLKTIDGFLEL
jgi:hypothetical protein